MALLIRCLHTSTEPEWDSMKPGKELGVTAHAYNPNPEEAEGEPWSSLAASLTERVNPRPQCRPCLKNKVGCIWEMPPEETSGFRR